VFTKLKNGQGIDTVVSDLQLTASWQRRHARALNAPASAVFIGCASVAGFWAAGAQHERDPPRNWVARNARYAAANVDGVDTSHAASAQAVLDGTARLLYGTRVAGGSLSLRAAE